MQSCYRCTEWEEGYFQHVLVQVASKFGSAYFREDAEGETDDIVVVSV